MEQKMITIPFEVEKAKKIQSGEEPGKIVTRDGKDARVAFFDLRSEDDKHILTIYERDDGYQGYGTRFLDGRLNDYMENDKDLMLQIPEWTQFKDGDILATKIGSCFVLNANGEFKTSCYVGLFHNRISFGGAVDSDHIEVMTYATEEEKQELIDALKASTDPRAKEYLKRFFGIEKEEKPECKFEFLQPVLVRDGKDSYWKYGEFTYKRDGIYYVNGGLDWMNCIPYNEQTKHLLGTTDNWEE